MNSVDVPSGVTLTIDSGVIVKMDSSDGINVDTGGTLNVNGTSGSPVVFTSYADDSAGGDTNGDGSSTSPAVGDYSNAITPDGGTVDVAHANFAYASKDIGDSVVTGTGSHLTVTDSSFTDSDVGIYQVNDNSVSLQRNSFSLGTPGSQHYAIYAREDDLSGIVLSGTDKNTFSGSGANVTVAADGGVPTGATWDVASGPVLLLLENGVDVTGTVNIDSGAIVKPVQIGFDVESGGVLNATGSSESPVVFTSYEDDSAGGDSTGDGSTTGSAGDYNNAILPDGGTVDASYVDFSYASKDIGDSETTGTGSDLTVTDSSFTDSDVGVYQSGDSSISLQRNSFALDTAGSQHYAIYAREDDLSGIVLSGTDKNTFSGSGANVTVAADGDVPTDATWEIASGPVLFVLENGVDVTGTVNIDSGAIVKMASNNGFDVESGATLDATGTSESPVVFTSYEDDSVGGDSTGDGSTTGSVGDYTTVVRFEHPDSSDVISYVVFKYATKAISIGAVGSLGIDHTQFTHNTAAFDADTTSTENPVLGSLASDCLWPYASTISISDSWFGAGTGAGYPGNNIDVSGYIGETVPDPSDYPGLNTAYNDFTTLEPFTVDEGDNTIPWTVFTCDIPGTDLGIDFPVTPVDLANFEDSEAIATSQLWTASNLAE